MVLIFMYLSEMGTWFGLSVLQQKWFEIFEWLLNVELNDFECVLHHIVKLVESLLIFVFLFANCFISGGSISHNKHGAFSCKFI